MITGIFLGSLGACCCCAFGGGLYSVFDVCGFMVFGGVLSFFGIGGFGYLLYSHFESFMLGYFA